MKSSAGLVRLAAATCCILFAAAWLLAATGSYHLIKKYSFGPAPGSSSEYFDYITVDALARRVYLSRGTEVTVIDADTGALIGNITGLQRDHGVALAPEFGRGFISDGALGTVTIFELKSLKVIGRVKADKDADCVVYDPASRRVFAMEGDPHAATVIDAGSGSVVGTIELGGAPEFAVADGRGMLYVNLESQNEVIALDSHSLQIKSRWPVVPAGGPTALAMDVEHHRLFSAGRNPQMLVVMDAGSGKVIQSFPISAGADAARYDPDTGLIFVSTREGKLHIFHEDSPDKYSIVQTVDTDYGAKTMGLDTKTHHVFVDTADFGPPGPSAPGRSRPRRMAVSGTFRVLVYGW
jgi:hypothetical protein